LFYVNWFRKDASGKFLWPGYGENSRVLAWVFDRCRDAAEAVDTPIGRLPTVDSLPTEGLDVTDDALAELLAVDRAAWQTELPLIEAHYADLREPPPRCAPRARGARRTARLTSTNREPTTVPAMGIFGWIVVGFVAGALAHS
jgi:GTP-dependent phosphoenolpyruvate carboxykinase